MRLVKPIMLIVCASLLTPPQSAKADDDKEALQLCSAAFIEHLAETFGPADYRFVLPHRESFELDGGRLSASPIGGIEYLLTATRTETGEVIARTACKATRSGVRLEPGDRPR